MSCLAECLLEGMIKTTFLNPWNGPSRTRGPSKTYPLTHWTTGRSEDSG